MKDMYYQGGHPPEPCGPHPEWTPYPHPGCPPKAYYMTAYDIAVKYGYRGTEEEWIASHTGLDGLSSYQIFLKYNPESTLTEEQWEAAVDADRAAAEAARDAAVAAKNATIAVGITDYKTVKGQVQAITRKLAAVTNGLVNSVKKGGVFETFKRMNAGEHPSLDDYEMFWKDEHFLDFGQAFAPADTPVKCTVDGTEYDLPGQLFVLRGSLAAANMWWLPTDFINNNVIHGGATSMGWQIWRRKMSNYNDENHYSAWECVNGVDPDACDWISRGV